MEKFLEIYLFPAVPELLGGFIALLCAIIGARAAGKWNMRQAKRTELRDAYADLLASYYIRAQNMDADSLLKVAIASERVLLTCSPDAEIFIRNAFHEAAQNPINLVRMDALEQQIRLHARKELGRKR